MGQNKGTHMANDQTLAMGDYLTSPNGVFFALLQIDGNFAVYRGTGPGDIHGAALWAASGGWDGIFAVGTAYYVTLKDTGLLSGWIYQSDQPDGKNDLWEYPDSERGHFDYKADGEPPCFITLEDDGRVCVYNGTPDQRRGLVWASTERDPVVDCDEITAIEYDVEHWESVSRGSPEFYRQTFQNNVDKDQTFTIHGSATVTETRGWSNALQGKVNVKTEFKAGVPMLAAGKVEVGLEISDTYTWNGSTAKAMTYSFDQPLTVPPHKTYVAVVTATVSGIKVPYTVKGTLVLKSKQRIAGGTTKGIYTGTNSHDWNVTISEKGGAHLQMVPTSRALEVTRVGV